VSRGVAHSPLRRRSAGILLHPTSLPGPGSNGELGHDASRFVDFLAAAGQRVWQVLPMGPTHGDRSPYQSLSSHAGNPELISGDLLIEAGWVAPESDTTDKRRLVRAAWAGFQARADGEARERFARFCTENGDWLEDFALFRVIRERHGGRAWTDWPAPLRDRDPEALERVRSVSADALEVVRFEQYLFEEQWQRLKGYANERGVAMFGDMPIFVAHDSTDVWAGRRGFLLDREGHPEVVAGVPPDYFSETGQRWGNPHYDWAWMEESGFQWWLRRMERQLYLFDLVRIDHFRGFEAYWEVPAAEETAINGRWVEAPGDALFARLHERFDPLPVVAEDLGTITPEVEALRKKYALPGMKILQFAFGGDADNPYLPHNHARNSVVYTGTHDNDTTLGWFNDLPEGVRDHLATYLGEPGEEMPWPLIRAAHASVARLAVLPMQDVLGLDGTHRMNQPGTIEGNWGWRFTWDMVEEGLEERLAGMVRLYGR